MSSRYVIFMATKTWQILKHCCQSQIQAVDIVELMEELKKFYTDPVNRMGWTCYIQKPHWLFCIKPSQLKMLPPSRAGGDICYHMCNTVWTLRNSTKTHPISCQVESISKSQCLPLKWIKFAVYEVVHITNWFRIKFGKFHVLYSGSKRHNV